MPQELPRYVCHKEVRAVKIKSVRYADAKYYLSPADEGYADIVVEPVWMDKHGAKAGGYYVVYQDGYASFSPAKAFEEGYTAVPE
jgi:hypothetical protein